jgi:hypothetical protein
MANCPDKISEKRGKCHECGSFDHKVANCPTRDFNRSSVNTNRMVEILDKSFVEADEVMQVEHVETKICDLLPLNKEVMQLELFKTKICDVIPSNDYVLNNVLQIEQFLLSHDQKFNKKYELAAKYIVDNIIKVILFIIDDGIIKIIGKDDANDEIKQAINNNHVHMFLNVTQKRTEFLDVRCVVNEKKRWRYVLEKMRKANLIEYDATCGDDIKYTRIDSYSVSGDAYADMCKICLTYSDNKNKMKWCKMLDILNKAGLVDYYFSPGNESSRYEWVKYRRIIDESIVECELIKPERENVMDFTEKILKIFDNKGNVYFLNANVLESCSSSGLEYHDKIWKMYDQYQKKTNPLKFKSSETLYQALFVNDIIKTASYDERTRAAIEMINQKIKDVDGTIIVFEYAKNMIID